MDTQYKDNALNVISLDELERRRDEFDVPDGAISAVKAGSAPVIVSLRGTGKEYEVINPHESKPALTTEGPTSSETKPPRH